MFAWCFKISHVNAYILYCLTRNVGENTTHLIKFKQTLIKELVNQANKIIPGDHKQHVTKKTHWQYDFFQATFSHCLLGTK